MTEIDLPKGLIYVCDEDPGLKRKKWGRGFTYIDSSGNRMADKEVLKRIKELAIPPAWQDVWICASPHGYLQATGRDDKNRKQYKYHPEWEIYSNNSKFAHILEFADQLPQLRRRYEADLKDPEWSRKKVLALVTSLADELLLRVGSDYYTEKNNTYGLTTLRRKHINFGEDGAHFEFIGKKGSERELDLKDDFLINLLKECSELPGYNLFRYKDKGGMQNIDSADFNEYINEHLSENMHISAKDFRTWGGTVLCVLNAGQAREICEASPRKKLETTLIRLVSEYLGNTVAVCKKYYIHPDVLQYCIENEDLTPSKKSKSLYSEFDPEEQMALQILNKN